MKREEKEAIVANYLALPKEVRPHSLATYCESIGVTVSSEVYKMARNPKIVSKALQLLGVNQIASVTDVFDELVAAAKGGNVRAADVFLKHVRELATIGASEQSEQAPLHRLLEDTAKAAANLNRLADSIERGELMRPVAEQSRENITEADYADVDTRKATQAVDYKQVLDSVGGDLLLDAPPRGVADPLPPPPLPPPNQGDTPAVAPKKPVRHKRRPKPDDLEVDVNE